MIYLYFLILIRKYINPFRSYLWGTKCKIYKDELFLFCGESEIALPFLFINTVCKRNEIVLRQITKDEAAYIRTHSPSTFIIVTGKAKSKGRRKKRHVEDTRSTAYLLNQLYKKGGKA
jgi:hypothetical protein